MFPSHRSIRHRTLELSRKAGDNYLFTSDRGLNHERNCRAGVVRRTSVLNPLDTAPLDALLRQSDSHVGRLGFKDKKGTKTNPGMVRYVQNQASAVESAQVRTRMLSMPSLDEFPVY